jgi:GNAT superfamily N-acetyltransferase
MTTRYELPGLFHLLAADTAEFLRYWVAYRQVVEDYALDFAAQMQELTGATDAFWVMRGEVRCGGLFMRPNHLSHCFLIPPFTDAHAMLAAVLPLLNRWSERGKPLVAQKIAPAFVPALQGLGFKIMERHCWMIRPTAVLPTTLPLPTTLEQPAPHHAAPLAALLYDAFSGGAGQYGARSLASYQQGVNRFLQGYDPADPIGAVSVIVRHPDEPEGLIGACLVGLHKNLPAIDLVAVHPRYQRQGMATALIHRAITLLEPQAGWVKIALSAENPALSLYTRLGFVAATPLFTLHKTQGFRPTAVL